MESQSGDKKGINLDDYFENVESHSIGKYISSKS